VPRFKLRVESFAAVPLTIEAETWEEAQDRALELASSGSLSARFLDSMLDFEVHEDEDELSASHNCFSH
jgi:hypothetical protein